MSTSNRSILTSNGCTLVQIASNTSPFNNFSGVDADADVIGVVVVVAFEDEDEEARVAVGKLLSKALLSLLSLLSLLWLLFPSLSATQD